MSHLLDTDFCISWFRGNPSSRHQLQKVGWDDVAVSIITVAEIYVGAYKSDRLQENLTLAHAFLSHTIVLPLSDEILHRFADLKVCLQRQGERLEDFDLLIAATALAEGRTLVTGNRRHFDRVPGLRIEDWVHP